MNDVKDVQPLFLYAQMADRASLRLKKHLSCGALATLSGTIT